MSSLQIICAGFTEMFKVPIKTRAELEAQGVLVVPAASGEPQPTKVTVNQLFELTYRVTMSPEEATVTLPSERDTIGYVIVKFLQGNTISVPITHESKVRDVQKAVGAEEGHSSKAIRLIYGGTTLTKDGGEDMELRERGIGPDDVISAIIAKVDDDSQASGLSGLSLYIDDDLLDPSYNYDFTNIDDGATRHMRGGYQYKRPCGWRRFALRVLGVYGDDKWLNSNIGGDWPVSYHGIQLCDQPVQDSPSEKTRQVFGKGHYSSPSVLVAQKYGTEFTFQGVKYAMVLQNRVNPKTTRMIPQSETGDLDEYWITTNAEDIRAYSICIKKI